MIDNDARVRFNHAVNKARREGRDLAEVLDEAALLHTALRKEAAAEQGLLDLWDAFERRDPTTFMTVRHGRTYGSPEDMHRAIADFLYSHVHSKRVGVARRGGHRG